MRAHRFTYHSVTALLALCVSLLAGAAWADPPGRVGRLSVMEGEVWLADSSNTERFIGTPNWPITQSTAIETGYEARAEVRIGSSAFRFAPQTRANFERLDDQSIRLRVESGSVAVRFRNSDKARETVVTTARGNVVFFDAGRYRIDVDGWGTTSLTTLAGNMRFDGRDISVAVGSGRRLELASDGSSRFVERYNDSFSDWVVARDRSEERRSAPQYVSDEMTGYETLEENGSWSVSADYGPVWYPRYVDASWAPYRAGQWAWVNPWGWTWVDAAPWGFAVSHYGRWAYVNSRWGWVPGTITPRPVYAPALVAWAGGSNWSVSVNFGGPTVGWVPLAPREVFVPYYPCQPRYWNTVNAPYVRDVTVVNYVSNHPNSQSYANTVVPGAVTAAAAGRLAAAGAAAGASGAAVAGGRNVRPPNFVATNYQAVTNAIAAREAFTAHRLVSPAAIAVAPTPAGRASSAAAAAAGLNTAGGTRFVPPTNPVVSNAAGGLPNQVRPGTPVGPATAPANAAASAAAAAQMQRPAPAPVPQAAPQAAPGSVAAQAQAAQGGAVARPGGPPPAPANAAQAAAAAAAARPETQIQRQGGVDPNGRILRGPEVRPEVRQDPRQQQVQPQARPEQQRPEVRQEQRVPVRPEQAAAGAARVMREPPQRDVQAQPPQQVPQPAQRAEKPRQDKQSAEDAVVDRIRQQR